MGLEQQYTIDPITAALKEDLDQLGDLTARFFVSPNQLASARIVAKQDAVVAGTQVAAEVFHRVDPDTKVEVVVSDGSKVAVGQTVLTIQGKATSLLTAERVALNFIQGLSGVATLTREFVDAVKGLPVILLDTRKTTPGLRALEKYAVRMGGGVNHRFGLFDRIMVKDNHLLSGPFASGQPDELQKAIDSVKQQYPQLLVELEADTLSQVETFLKLRGVDWILLDNMTLSDLKSAVEMRGSRGISLEASGGVNLQTVRAIAQTGVDAISVGALTHSAVAVDFSLDFHSH